MFKLFKKKIEFDEYFYLISASTQMCNLNKHDTCIPCNPCNLSFTQHFKERLRERKIDIDLNDINIKRILGLPHYIDNGCYKYLDNKHQVIYYIRKNHNGFKLETIIKTNKIQMLRNLCDAHRMLCETNITQIIYVNIVINEF